MSLPYANTPAIKDKQAYQGSDFYWEFNIYSNNEAVNLTGVGVELTIKKQRGKDVPVLYKANLVTGQIVIVSPNKVKISIPKSVIP